MLPHPWHTFVIKLADLKLAGARLFWIASSALTAFTAITWTYLQEQNEIRTRAYAEILLTESKEISTFRESLTKRNSSPFSESSFATELMDHDVLFPRREFHFELANQIGLTVPSSEDLRASHLDWLTRLEPELTKFQQAKALCDSLTPSGLKSRILEKIRSTPKYIRLRETQKNLSTIWKQRLELNRKLAAKLFQDFQHDRARLCHSRKSLGNMMLMAHFLEEKCKSPSYHCGLHLPKLNQKVRDLASVEQTNALKFTDKWGVQRLHAEKLCE